VGRRRAQERSPDRAGLRRRGFLLEYAGLAWMTVEAAVAIASGLAAHSVALLGFGLDSVIEFIAGVTVVWELRGAGAEREHFATRLIASSFFLLATYVAAEAIRDLLTRARPEWSCRDWRSPSPPWRSCRPWRWASTTSVAR
jgi:hypothetical protein